VIATVTRFVLLQAFGFVPVIATVMGFVLLRVFGCVPVITTVMGFVQLSKRKDQEVSLDNYYLDTNTNIGFQIFSPGLQ
jgi:tetrahydromethanopterin S-methyltransferase subunit E